MTSPFSAAEPKGTASTPVFLTTFGLILVSIATFLVFDLWLAAIDARESTLHAAHLYEDARVLMRSGNPHEAAERLVSARALARTNVRYGAALAEALLADGRVSEARTELTETLRLAESDGHANLVMARILARSGSLDQAASFYHRAIYGSWEDDAGSRRLAARMELVHLLARRGDRADMLAELLAVEDLRPDSVQLRRELAHLFQAAGSPERAVPIFREILRRDPRDGDAYAGLGEAALALGDFRTARADLLAAARLGGDSVSLASSLAVADDALKLDPTARGIDGAARLARSRELLGRTLVAVETCPLTGPSAHLADSARAELAAPIDPKRTVGALWDGMLDLASEIWSRREPGCAASPLPADRALELVQRKLRS